ncbi:hypothetical protein ISS03_01375 [Patescibacteria group bacterium]|nr:hypothetical protein [Patescibacteria group bacterium]
MVVNKKTIYFSRYAEEKFGILNKHKVYLTNEQVEDCIHFPEECGKLNQYLTAKKEGLKVVYKKELGTITVLTFYPSA